MKFRLIASIIVLLVLVVAAAVIGLRSSEDAADPASSEFVP